MNNKIYEKIDLANKLQEFKDQNKKIVFTNGCFDILHTGHVRYLNAARAEGDILVVGLNSDQSVKTIKGPKRPIMNQDDRAEVLSGLTCVDYITIFNEPDPLILISYLEPDILVKGADWEEEEIIGADFVKSKGGKLIRVNIVPGISTTEVITRILDKYS